MAATKIQSSQIATSTSNAFTFNSGWSGDLTHKPMAIKVGGIVFLRGLILKNASWSANELMFTLPTGFRPSARMTDGLYMLFGNGTTSTGGLSANLTLNIYAATGNATDGQVVSRITGSANQWISLYGISYESE